MPNTSHFCGAWKVDYKWIDAVPGENTKANCLLCKKIFSVANGGITDVKKHSQTQQHERMIAKNRGQTHFFGVSPVCDMGLSRHESVIKAEIYFAMKTCMSNYSFASNDGMAELCQGMFPDSDIAKGYGQAQAKLNYSILMV